MGGLGNDDDSVLYEVLQGYLCGSLTVFLTNALQYGVFEDAMFTFSQRTPGLQIYVVRLQILEHLTLLIEHMGLTLVHNGHHLSFFHNLWEGVRIEIRHTNSLEHPLLIEFFERMPHDGRVAHGPVDKHQVHIVKSKLTHGMVNRAERLFTAVAGVAYLGRDEQFFPSNAARTDSLTYAMLIIVHGGSVYASIADADGLFYDSLCFPVRDVIDTKTHHRHFQAIVHRFVFHNRHFRIVWQVL